MIHSPSRRASRLVIGFVGWTLSLSLTAILIGGPLNLVLPFDPYTLQDYSIVPDKVCPGLEVKFTFRANIEKQPLAFIQMGDPGQAGDEAIRTLAQWVNMASGKKLEPENFYADFTGRYGSRSQVSNFIRYAPNEPGLWRQDITIFVTGRQALRPVTQVVPTFSTKPVEVLPFEAKQCR